MLTRSVGRALIESPWRIPPTFLMPLRAQLSTTSESHQRDPIPAALSSNTPAHRTTISEAIKPAAKHQTSPLQQVSIGETLSSASSSTSAPPAPKEPLSESVASLLPLLVSQPPHYATVHIHARAYLVTEGDVVRLPFRMPEVSPGDVLRLNRASLIGSRDFTLKGQPYVDDRLFECRAVVMSVEAEPMRYKEKTKRRNRKVKTVKSKHRYTEIAIQQLKVKDVNEVEL